MAKTKRPAIPIPVGEAGAPTPTSVVRLDELAARLEPQLTGLREEIQVMLREVLAATRDATLRDSLSRDLRDEITLQLRAVQTALATEIDTRSETPRRAMEAVDTTVRDLARRWADAEARLDGVAARVTDDQLATRVTQATDQVVKALLAPEVSRRLDELTGAYGDLDDQLGRLKQFVEQFGPGGLPVLKQAKDAAEARAEELEQLLASRVAEIARLQEERSILHKEGLNHRMTQGLDVSLLARRVEEIDLRERDLSDREALGSENKRLTRKIEELTEQVARWTAHAETQRSEQVDRMRLQRFENEALEAKTDRERAQRELQYAKQTARESQTRAESAEARLREVHVADRSMAERDARLEVLTAEISDRYVEREQLGAQIAELRTAHAQREDEALALQRQLDALQSARDRELIAERREGVEQARQDLQAWAEERVKELHQRLITQCADLTKDLESARTDQAQLRERLVSTETTLAQTQALVTRLQADLQQARAQLDDERARLLAHREHEREALVAQATAEATTALERMKVERASAEAQKAALDADAIRLTERRRDAEEQVQAFASQKGSLQGELEALRGRIDELRTRDIPEVERMASLDHPVHVVPPTVKVNKVQDEAAWLTSVHERIAAAGFSFHPRLVRAFHTSLKIANHAPLTILAGISGTGKSELPRLYADLGGVPFLELPVQPSWDSPQDLLGFFSYTDARFKAEPLARLLKQMGNAEDAIRQGPAIVLLDEMNLARVEYYFAELLSKLESRRAWLRMSDPEAKIAARDRASVSIDAGPGRRPLQLFLDPRVLFVGTMNEDESTLSISPKVLDRSCMLHFPAPRDMRMTAQKAVSHEVSRLSWDTWQSWIADDTDSVEDDTAKHLNEINGYMGQLGRPFGHRLFRAIHAYLVNYPAVDAVEDALADQFAMKIMPRLQGLECQDRRVRSALNALLSHVPKTLQDAYTEARSRDFFEWSGASELYRTDA